MKKSRVVELGLLLAIAGSLTACRRTQRVDQRCVDASGIAVEDKYCEQQQQQQPGTPVYGHGGGFYPYRWYYGGWATSLGARVGNGTYQTPAAADLVRPNSGGRVISGPHSTGGSSVRGVFGGTGSHSVGA